MHLEWVKWVMGLNGLAFTQWVRMNEAFRMGYSWIIAHLECVTMSYSSFILGWNQLYSM